MPNLGWQELVLIALLVMLIFGAKRVPEIFRSLGSGVNEFKKGLKEGATPEADSKKSAE